MSTSKRSYLQAATLLMAMIAAAPSANATTHTITFTSYSYSPNQLSVAVGDTIVWQGDFGFHPLQSTTVPPGANSFSHSSGTSFSYVVLVAGTYNYRCGAHYLCCNMIASFNATVTAIDGQQNSGPVHFQLEQNFPNPFNPTTTIRFTIPATQNVTLKVFDLLGNEVAVLIDGKKSTGDYSVEFKGTGLASGIYLYRLEGKDFRETKKLLLMK